jgi:type III pantothenate kinase
MKNELIKPPVFGHRTEVYRSIDSTQNRVREIFKNNPEESLVVAMSQCIGSGRRGRTWESPEGGLYFSVLINQQRNPLLSIYALIWALKSLEKENIYVCWKWPNDLLCDGKKVGGILTEILSHEWAVIGIGINTGLKIENFSEDLRKSLTVLNIDKEKFIENFLSHLNMPIENKRLTKIDNDFLNSRLVLKNKRIKVGDVEGKVQGIDEKGRLEIKSSGKIERVASGTVIDMKNKPLTDILLAAIDIGNTMTQIGKVEPEGKVMTSELSTKPHEDFPQRLVAKIKELFGKDLKSIKGAAVSCVVTPIEEKVVEILKTEITKNVLNVTANTVTDLKIDVKEPSQVGADRICNSIAACRIYGGNIVVVDLGTANTFDVISESCEYLGGIIAPGIDSMEEALIGRADKLRKYDYKLPHKNIGDNTATSMNIGMYYTLRGQIISILAAIKREWKKDFKVIFTGGGIKKLDREFLENYIIDRDITLKGLATIFNLHKTT